MQNDNGLNLYKVNLFKRWLGNPSTVLEPPYTQALASVIEHELDFAINIGEWIFSLKDISVNLKNSYVRVKTELPIETGGIPDIVIEYLVDGLIKASLIIENKLGAYPYNPFQSYLTEVKRRQNNGEISILVLISKRNARKDAELQSFINSNNFLYLDWHQIYTWISTKYLGKGFDSWLILELFEYMAGMGMDMTGKFTIGMIGLAEYIPSLINNLDKVIDEDQIDTLLKDITRSQKTAVQPWKNSAVYCKWTYINDISTSYKNYFAAAGFIFTRDDEFKETFSDESCPIIAFVGLGDDNRDDKHHMNDWLNNIMDMKGFDYEVKGWHLKEFPLDFHLISYLPLTEFMQGEDQVGLCRTYLCTKLSELQDLLK